MIWVTIGGGGGGSRQVAKTSKNVQKSARWSNRQHFAVRCKKENITPTSIKLHSNVKGVSEHFWWYYWLSSNWCHMIQKGHVTPTATSYHPLTKAGRFCRKFRNFFHHNFDSVHRMSHQKLLLLLLLLLLGHIYRYCHLWMLDWPPKSLTGFYWSHLTTNINSLYTEQGMSVLQNFHHHLKYARPGHHSWNYIYILLFFCYTNQKVHYVPFM